MILGYMAILTLVIFRFHVMACNTLGIVGFTANSWLLFLTGRGLNITLAAPALTLAVLGPMEYVLKAGAKAPGVAPHECHAAQSRQESTKARGDLAQEMESSA